MTVSFGRFDAQKERARARLSVNRGITSTAVSLPPDMIGRDRLVEHAKCEFVSRLEEPVMITAPVARELKEEYLSETAVSYVPDVSRQKVAVGARHRRRLDGLFRARKCASEPLKRLSLRELYR